MEEGMPQPFSLTPQIPPDPSHLIFPCFLPLIDEIFAARLIMKKKTWPLVNIFFNRSLFDIGNIFWFGEDSVHSIHIYLYLTTTVAFMDIF